MSEHSLTATASERLDRLVASLTSVGSRSRARKAIETGKVFVDEQVCTEPGAPVPAGATVEVRWNRPGTSVDRTKARAALDDAGLTILYQDDQVVAVDKPPGLLTDTASKEQHRTRDSVYKRLRALLRAAGDRPRTVHRIDRDTSGVVLFARSDQAEAALRDQFRARSPERVYRAIVVGSPDWNSQTWRDHTRWHKGRRILEKVHAKTPGAWETISHAAVVRRMGELTELEVRLTTGRRNQIRLQASLRGLPLLGERLYVDRTHPRPANAPRAARQLLHAHELQVLHPTSRTTLTVRAPLPRDWPR